MFCVGKTPIKLNNLIDATYESMMRAIKILKPGIKIGDITPAILAKKLSFGSISIPENPILLKSHKIIDPAKI